MALELPEGLTLYIARHGETLANVEGRFQGRTIDTPLTPRGRDQAVAVAEILARNALSVSALCYISSPLSRARTTMAIILDALGLPPDIATTDDRIVEIDLGDWDGLTHAEARALDPAAYEAREADKWSVRATSSRENYSDVAKRAEDWIGDLRADTFAISHGAFTRILRGLFEGLTWKQMSDLDEEQGVVFRVRGREVVRLRNTAPPQV